MGYSTVVGVDLHSILDVHLIEVACVADQNKPFLSPGLHAFQCRQFLFKLVLKLFEKLENLYHFLSRLHQLRNFLLSCLNLRFENCHIDFVVNLVSLIRL